MRRSLLFVIMLLVAFVGNAQTRTITGIITNEKNEPVEAATVQVKGKTTGVISNETGYYAISANNNDVLQFISVGYITQERPVGNLSEINVQLSATETSLSDVVVIGYGTQRKSDVTGSVSTIGGNAIARVQTANPAQALQGLAPGVNVVANSGAPGSSVAVRIRGIATVLGGAEPLFVVDGVPVSDITFLGNNDIASVNILKDASATAIYGARGANGVVLITTKQGNRGVDIISFNASWGLQSVNTDLNLLSGKEWVDIQTEINKTRAKPIDLTKANPAISTNWMQEITRKAPMQNYDLGFSGGNESIKYNIAVGFMEQLGTIKKTDYQRMNVRTAVEKKMNKLITVGLNATLSSSKRNNVLEGSNTVGIVNSAIKLEPVVPVKNADGSWGYSNYIDYPNPVAAIEFTNNLDKSLSLIGNVYGIVNITEGLNYKLLVGTDMRRTDAYIFEPVYYVNNAQQNPISKVTRGNYNRNYLLLENTLNYNKIFNEVHNVNAMLGYTSEKTTYENLGASKQNTPNNSPEMQWLDAAQLATSAVATGGLVENNLISYIARVNYGLHDRYIFTASMRADGSSRFGAGNRYGYFPSFAFAYRLSNEDFFKQWNQDVINSVKFRVGWGRVGNQNIDDYAFQNIMSANAQYAYLFGKPEILYQGLVAVAMGNKGIKWETTQSTNVGVDMDMFNKRLNFSADYYHKLTKDMLFREPIPYYFGFETGPMSNVGEALNKGFEFQIGWHDNIGNFNYNIGANLSTVYNEMLSIGTGVPLPSASIRNGSAALTKVGYPIGMFWGYKTGGLINTEEQLAKVKTMQPNAGLGDVVFLDIAGAKDANGNDVPDGKITDADKTMIGKPLPDFYYGFNIGFEYKGIDLTAFFEGSQGNDIFNAMRYFTYDMADVTNKTRDVLNYWTPANTNTNIPRINGNDKNDNKRISDMYIEDGSYLRLKTLQLGYNLPVSKISLVKNARIFVAAQNLLTITKYSGADPEIGQINATNYLSRGVDIGTYPQAKIFSLGVNLNF